MQTKLPLYEIKPYPKNAKIHTEKQVEKIAQSIKAFGFNQPIVVDQNNVIVVGHGRYHASILLGLSEVPVIKIDIDEDKARAYRIADNKLNESEWDKEVMEEEIRLIPEELLALEILEPIAPVTDYPLATPNEDETNVRTPKQCKCPSCGHLFFND